MSASDPPGPLIAATLIARDEARCIARCLASLRPWVDRMIVLDTGSTDATMQLARAGGAEVHQLAWPGDFSAARNHALDLADADWNVVVDADEWVMAGGELLRDWCSGPPRLGRVCIHNAFESGGGETATSRSWITRILPRGARFRGRVHEQVPADLPREPVGLHLGHDGYLPAQLAGKRGRNLPLLLRDLEDNPGDPYIAYQLGREAEGDADFAAACDRYAQSLDATPARANWRHELVHRYLHCLGQAGRLQDALALAEREMPAYPDSPDVFFVVGNLLLDRALSDPAQAVDHWLPLAVSAWERCLAIGERPELEGSVNGRGSHLAQHNLDVVRAQLALLGGRTE